MKYLLIVSILILSSYFELNAQNKPDTVTNKTVVQLKTIGMGADVIKAKIQSSYCQFDLSTNGLISLKQSGISDDVIAAMLNKSNTSQSNSGSNNNNGNQDTQNAVSPGIYYSSKGSSDLKELEASVYSQSKMGSGLLTAVTYGIAKTKMKATLSGIKANMQIDESKPTFYFYFDKSSGSNFGNNGNQIFWFSSATSPNEFILVKFTVAKKNREVVTGSWSTYSGMSSGIDDANKVSFKYEKTSQGVYRVYTEQPLEPGEYCFMYAGGSTAAFGAAPLQKVYDFGIK